MESFYTAEEHTRILIALLKAHSIKKIIASPGATNITLVGSLQCDPYFEIYSSVDERSAAYMACGLAEASGEPVALSCTGATASRNYVPGLTEAFYRKLPVLAITSTQHEGRIGHNVPQVIDRRVQMNDIVKLSVSVPEIHSEDDRWASIANINRALLELHRDGGGPVHINLATTYSRDFSIKKLPDIRIIHRYSFTDPLPEIPSGKVAVFVGAHSVWNEKLTSAVDEFCEKYNGVVLCDQTSNYRGKYRVLPRLVTSQQYHSPCWDIDLLVDIGNISGSELSFHTKQVWRVNPDGEVRDTYRRLTDIFQMEEYSFFEKANALKTDRTTTTYYKEWIAEITRIREKLPSLPFSNPWIAEQTAHRLPEGSALYLGIFNTLRSWNYFETPDSVSCYSNTGGFGIDGGVSTLLGMSLANAEQLFFGIVGDLGFFYDMNALGNRHVGSNLRLMIINNGCGTEFKNYGHPAAAFKEDADAFIAARGHFGRQSAKLVKHYAEDLGFIYMSASNKEEYLNVVDRFVTPEPIGQAIIFEVFTDSQYESDAHYQINHVEMDATRTAKNVAKRILGEKGTQTVKKILKK